MVNAHGSQNATGVKTKTFGLGVVRGFSRWTLKQIPWRL